MNVVVAEQARALVARGHEVVIATRASGEIAPGAYEMGRDRLAPILDTRSDGMHRGAGRATGRDASAAASTAVDPAPTLVALEAGPPGLRKGELPAILPEFSRRLGELGPFDAVHAHYWLSGEAAAPLARGSGCGLAITLHTVAAQKNSLLASGDAPEPEERLDAEARLARDGFIIAGSRSEFEAIERWYGRSRLGAEVVNPGIDTALFRPRGAGERGSGEGPLRITVLGRVQPLKGQDLAIEAAGELARRDPELWSRCELIVAGEPTPGAEAYASSLRVRAEELGIAERVRFLPAQDREGAARLLASSAVVLVPSHSETFGLVALEAAASGVPTIVGGHTGLVEAAPAGETSVHVEGRNPGDWAGAIAALLGDPERRSALGRSARLHALAHDWHAHAERLERIYSALAGRRSARRRAYSARKSSSWARASSSGFCTGGDFMK